MRSTLAVGFVWIAEEDWGNNLEQMNWLSVFRGPRLRELCSHVCHGEVSKRDITQTCEVSKTDMMQVEVHNDYGTTYPLGGCTQGAEPPSCGCMQWCRTTDWTDGWTYMWWHVEPPRIADDGRLLHGGFKSRTSCLWRLVRGDWMNPVMSAGYSDKHTRRVSHDDVEDCWRARTDNLLVHMVGPVLELDSRSAHSFYNWSSCMPLLVDCYIFKGQSPAMADSPHLREISLSLSDPHALQMSCIGEWCEDLINPSMIADSVQMRPLLRWSHNLGARRQLTMMVTTP